MSILQFYLILSTCTVLILENFYNIFRESYSWWLVPALLLGFYILFILLQFATLGLMILFTGKKTYTKGSPFLRFLLKHSLPIALALLKIEVNKKGVEQYIAGEKMLFVCNHQQLFDPVIMFSVFPHAKLSFIGKKDIQYKMKFIAKAMRRLGCLFIDRENDREAAKTIVTAIRNLKEGPCSMGLFPEGYCSKTCELQPFRNGSLKIALKTQVPIAVCVINNTQQIPKNYFRKTSEIDFQLVKIIQPEEYEGMNTTELGNKIRDIMLPALTALRSPKTDE